MKTANSSAIEVFNLTVAYHEKPVLWDINRQFHPVLMAIIGPNGAGKTTLIKAILELLPSVSEKTLIQSKPYRHQRHLVVCYNAAAWTGTHYS